MSRSGKIAMLVSTCFLLLIPIFSAKAAVAGTKSHLLRSPKEKETGVYVNGARVADEVLQKFQAAYKVGINPGRYWYDARCGAWGFEGNGTAGFIPAKLGLGGRLHSSASAGETGVFVNGRQLPSADVLALQQQGIPVFRGRYWLDAKGNGGTEGGAATFNLVALARKSASNGGSWSHTTGFGGSQAHVGGDGNGFFYYLDSKGSSYSSGN